MTEEKLKTLRELRHEAVEKDLKEEDLLWFEQRQKEEAIKWIKRIKEKFHLKEKNMPCNLFIEHRTLNYLVDEFPEERRKCRGISSIATLMHFFNITKQDLEENDI